MKENWVGGGVLLFFEDSVMTLTFDLETLCKVAVYLIPKDTMWMKYEPDWVERWESMLRASDVDKQADHCRALTEGYPIFKTETTTRCTIFVIYLLDMRAAYYFVDLKTQTLHNVGSEDDSSVWKSNNSYIA